VGEGFAVSEKSGKEVILATRVNWRGGNSDIPFIRINST
jgi:hypothetical protein